MIDSLIHDTVFPQHTLAFVHAHFGSCGTSPLFVLLCGYAVSDVCYWFPPVRDEPIQPQSWMDVIMYIMYVIVALVTGVYYLMQCSGYCVMDGADADPAV